MHTPLGLDRSVFAETAGLLARQSFAYDYSLKKIQPGL